MKGMINMKHYGLLGFPLRHTMSPPIHQRLFKLEGVSDKWALKTVWGVGYKFEAEEENA